MGIQSIIARLGGKLSVSYTTIGLWFWPHVSIGKSAHEVTFADYRAFTACLLPGDILLTRGNEWFASNGSIPGAFKHLAVYVGPVEGEYDKKTKFITGKVRSLGLSRAHEGRVTRRTHERAVVHAISEGVVIQDLGDVLMKGDYVAVVRPTHKFNLREIIVNVAMSQVGKEYDFYFDMTDTKKLFCTQLGIVCLKMARLPLPDMTKIVTRWWGRLPIIGLLLRRWATSEIPLADSFTEYDIVCTTDSCNDPAFSRNSILGDKMRMRLFEAPDAFNRR